MAKVRAETTRQRLYGLQTDPTSRWRATVLAGAVGALLATVHWSGLLVGGALVGLAWPTLRRALVAGLGFGVAVGALLATVHWSGLLVGGALVGLAWPTLRRALVAGLGFGVAVVAVFALELALAGSLSEVLAMGVFGVVPAVVPLVAGPLGAASRGLFPDADGE